MSSPDTNDHNMLDDLIGPNSTGTDSTGPIDRDLQRQVLLRTKGVLGQRRRMRHFGMAAALVVCYLAGMATMQIRSNEAAGPAQTLVEDDGPGEPKHVPPAESPRVAPKQEKPPTQRLTPYEALCRKSDRYLQSGDISLAVRYSNRALKHATGEQRAVSPDDNFVTMALKLDSKKEP